MKKVICLIFSVVFLNDSSVLGAGSKFGEKPNIIIVLADDLSWRDLEPYGNPDVRTPNIQRLADQGMTFSGMSTATAMCFAAGKRNPNIALRADLYYERPQIELYDLQKIE